MPLAALCCGLTNCFAPRGIRSAPIPNRWENSISQSTEGANLGIRNSKKTTVNKMRFVRWAHVSEPTNDVDASAFGALNIPRLDELSYEDSFISIGFSLR